MYEYGILSGNIQWINQQIIKYIKNDAIHINSQKLVFLHVYMYKVHGKELTNIFQTCKMYF